MEEKLKKLLQLLALIEEVVIKIISLVGWVIILIKVVEGG